jgi:hypothetical protein
VRKSIVALLVIAAIVILISPGIIGRIAEEFVDSNLQWAADESQDIVVTSERLDRGWFSSHGRHRIEIRDEEIRVALATIAGRDPAYRPRPYPGHVGRPHRGLARPRPRPRRLHPVHRVPGR